MSTGPIPAAHPPLFVRGDDVEGMRLHWRGGMRQLQLLLRGGDVVLLDSRALQLLCDSSRAIGACALGRKSR